MSPFEVAESVNGRPKDNSSWSGSESECRDAVCVGVLRNSTDVHHPHLQLCSSVFCRGHGVGDSRNLGMKYLQFSLFRETRAPGVCTLGIAGQIAGKSSDTQFASYSVELHQQYAHDSWRCLHTLASSGLPWCHFRASAVDRRQCHGCPK